MGNDQLIKLCIRLSKIPQAKPTIFIFDRDEETFVKKASEAGKDYRMWGNNVYSMVLPVPKHRDKTPDVCIELYYSDRDLLRRDSNNRRIYINTEFQGKSGAHKTRALFCRDNAVNGSKLSVIDKEVYNRKGENVALSKNDFAEHILKKDKGFTDIRFSSFDPIFRLLEEIIKESRTFRSKLE
jgi:RNA-directed DNA polymerase